MTPAIHIVELPGPFAFARCDVRLLPGNEIAGTMAYENHDLALRPAIRMDGNVDPVDAAGAPIVNSSITVRGMLRPAGGSGGPANAGSNTFTQAAPAPHDLQAATAIDCLPRRVLFANGDVWMRLDQPRKGWSDPADARRRSRPGSSSWPNTAAWKLRKRISRPKIRRNETRVAHAEIAVQAGPCLLLENRTP